MLSFHEFRQYVDSLYAIDQAFDHAQTDRLARHRHLAPVSAQFLASLIMSRGSRQVLEIGTSTGYSTLWLAYALTQCHTHHQTTVKLTSVELDAQRLLTAKNHLMTLRLNAVTSLVQADARQFLAECQTPFDVIFLDAERACYLDYVPDLQRLLPFGSVLIVDNVISHDEELAEFLAQFYQDADFLCTTLPIGAGLLMAVRQTPHTA